MDKQSTTRPNIYEEWDHIKILNDFVSFKKMQNPYISIDTIAKKSGVYKRSLLSLVLSGKRSLQEEKISPLGKALGMKSPEIQYLKILTNFNSTKDTEKAKLLLNSLMLKKPLQANLVGEKQTLLGKWYYIPLLEFVKIPGFKFEPEWIQNRFRRKISKEEIEEAISLFKNLKILEQKDHQWVINETVLSSPMDIPSKAIQVFHLCCIFSGGRKIA